MEGSTLLPSEDEVRGALDRVLSSDGMSGSQRRKKLLSYLVTEALAGRQDRLKATTIAIDVFGRGSDFDQQLDAVVRSEARRLRQTLATYYVGDGADDPMVISIPKGRYVPFFSYRAGAAPRTSAGDPAGDRGEEQEPGRAVPVGPNADDPVQGAGRRARFAPSRLAIAASAIVAVVFLTAIFVWTMRRETMIATEAPPPSVLAYPFEVAGSSDDLQQLSLGLTSQLIADLMRFRSFRLFSFEDTLRWSEGARQPPQEADFVVRGVVSSDRDRIFLVVRLVDTSDGTVVWSEDYTRPFDPNAIAAMKDELSGEIAAKIGEPYGVVRSAFADVDADPDATFDASMSTFLCVMRAHTYRHANRSDFYAPARTCLDAAVLRDPDSEEAWALLAYLRLDGARFGYEARTPEERSDALAAARVAAARALALDPENELAMNALAMIEHYAGRYEESRRYSEIAVRLNPNDPSTLAYHGWRLGARGNLEEGVAFVGQAIARSVNPQPTFYHVIAIDRMMAGDMEAMLVAAERASEDRSSVSDALLAIAYGALGLEDPAGEALVRMGKKWPLLAEDPAAAFGLHGLHPDLIDAIVAGLRTAGLAVGGPD